MIFIFFYGVYESIQIKEKEGGRGALDRGCAPSRPA